MTSYILEMFEDAYETQWPYRHDEMVLTCRLRSAINLISSTYSFSFEKLSYTALVNSTYRFVDQGINLNRPSFPG